MPDPLSLRRPAPRTRGTRRRHLPALALALGVTLVIGGCATLQQVAQLRNVDFDLRGVSGLSLAGVVLDDVRRVHDLGPLQLGRIALGVSRRELPLELVLDVGALNPAENDVSARLTRLEWTFLLEDRETVSGTVEADMLLPPGEPRVVPVRVGFDLYDFFEGDAEALTRLVLGLAGGSAEATDVALRAVPIIDTALGPIRYPRPITIARGRVGGARP